MQRELNGQGKALPKLIAISSRKKALKIACVTL